jgi:hypothetical protein
MTIDELLDARPRDLERAMVGGHPFDPAELDGAVYRGISLGLPAWIERLTWKKFAKGFRRDGGGRLRGWNQRIVQDGLDQPWRPKLRRGRPVIFGHFEVVTDDRGGVVLDYRGAELALRAVRDPLVALHAGSIDVLLGRSLLDVGVTTLGTPSYFVLQRDAALTTAARAASRHNA